MAILKYYTKPEFLNRVKQEPTILTGVPSDWLTKAADVAEQYRRGIMTNPPFGEVKNE